MSEISSIYGSQEKPNGGRRTRRQEADEPTGEQAGKAIVINAKLNADIRKAADRITKLQAERKALNEDITACISDIEAKGINRKALKAAIKRYQIEQADREEQDVSYAICCKALAIEHQFELPIDTTAQPSH